MKVKVNDNLHLSEDIFNTNIATAATREGLGDALFEEGKKNEGIVVLTADLTESTKTDKFFKKFPDRFIEMGVAEQNMAGVAAGLALSDKIPFMTSYSAFSPGRNWEQVRVAICYTGANVKIASSHSGFSASADGATHQALEDLATTRVLPNLTVISPADYWQTKRAVKAAANHKGPVYIRLSKNKIAKFTTSKTPFKIGEAQVLKEGSDITIAATGTLVFEALMAARELELKHRIRAEVINFHTIKPLDEKTIIASAKKTGHVLTIEEHQMAGGLGGAVAELLSEELPTPVTRMGVQDSFGESGSYDELLHKYGLSREHIIKKVKSLKLKPTKPKTKAKSKNARK